jgi:hypothetical protein
MFYMALIDYDRGSIQRVQIKLIDGLAARNKMNRRIKMRAGVVAER